MLWVRGDAGQQLWGTGLVVATICLAMPKEAIVISGKEPAAGGLDPATSGSMDLRDLAAPA